MSIGMTAVVGAGEPIFRPHCGCKTLTICQSTVSTCLLPNMGKLHCTTFPTCSRYSARSLRPCSLLTTHQLVFAQSLLYQLAVNLVKATFVFQYLRIFSHLHYPRYYCFLLLFLIIGAAAWGVFGIIFLCDPVKTYWDVRVDGRCMNAESHFWSTSIIGIVIDWAIWILPMPIVGKLRLPRRQKWGLLGVFGLGGL
jgi:hypothetical protein